MKVYKVSGDDYSALSFRQKYQGLLMKNVAKELLTEEQPYCTFKDDENYWELSIQGEITDEHSFKVGKSQQDYDDSKHTDLFLENEIIKG